MDKNQASRFKNTQTYTHIHIHDVQWGWQKICLALIRTFLNAKLKWT
jgi:hypothetical protein